MTGITINAHQVQRAREITAKMTPYFQERCHYMAQDYLNVQDLEPNSYDAVFYMESSLHCENHTDTFTQAYKVLKPGGRLVAFEVSCSGRGRTLRRCGLETHTIGCVAAPVTPCRHSTCCCRAGTRRTRSRWS